MQRKKIIIFVTIFSILSVILASTYAYWQYRGDNKNFSLVVNGLDKSQINYSGNAAIIGDILPNNTFCEGASTTISFSKDVSAKNIEVVADVYMDINSIGTNMSNSSDVYWIVTSGDSSIDCVNGLSSPSVVNYGNFNGKTAGDKITLLENIAVSITTKTYTVWIWIDSSGDDLSSLSGETIDVSVWTDMNAIGAAANAPELDPGMIPVTISDDGTVRTVSEDDPNWYDYGNKEWANVVLVNRSATAGVTDSRSRSYYLSNLSNNVEVEESDILAYYVWVPRYKYRIPYKKCSEVPVSKRNTTNYPECYAPYKMSDSDKVKLAKYYYDSVYNKDSSCPTPSDKVYEEALMMVNYALETGEFFKDKDYSEYTSIVSLVTDYNKGTVRNCGTPTGTVALTPSAFNVNNSLTRAGSEVSIDIMFETGNSSVSNGNALTTYYTHPAFVFGNKTISGIWVGKFEASPDPTSACYNTLSATSCLVGTPNESCRNAGSANCSNSTQSPRIIPNKTSLRYQSIKQNSDTSKKMTASGNIYGLSNAKTDSHLIKNSEWGAAAYLSHSRYGINSEIYINNSQGRITGRSGGNVGGNVGTNRYGSYTWLGEVVSTSGVIGTVSDTILGTNASTTGNVTGIYDMAGGSWEHTLGNYNNQDYLGFISSLDDKYKNIYLASQFVASNIRVVNQIFCTLDTCGGHALLETSSWYNDAGGFVTVKDNYFYFIRGGSFFENRSSGVFTFSNTNGFGNYSVAWRPVLVIS